MTANLGDDSRQLRRDFINIANGGLIFGRGIIRRNGGEGQFATGHGNNTLTPALVLLDKLTNRQRIKKFIGNEDQRHWGEVVEIIVMNDGLRMKGLGLLLLEGRAHFHHVNGHVNGHRCPTMVLDERRDGADGIRH